MGAKTIIELKQLQIPDYKPTHDHLSHDSGLCCMPNDTTRLPPGAGNKGNLHTHNWWKTGDI